MLFDLAVFAAWVRSLTRTHARTTFAHAETLDEQIVRLEAEHEEALDREIGFETLLSVMTVGFLKEESEFVGVGLYDQFTTEHRAQTVHRCWLASIHPFLPPPAPNNTLHDPCSNVVMIPMQDMSEEERQDKEEQLEAARRQVADLEEQLNTLYAQRGTVLAQEIVSDRSKTKKKQQLERAPCSSQPRATSACDCLCHTQHQGRKQGMRRT